MFAFASGQVHKIAYAIAWRKNADLRIATLRENVPLLYANKTGADQTAHLRSLISSFVFRYMRVMIAKHATFKFNGFC